MSFSPDDYAASFMASLDTYAAMRARSRQRGLGVSDIGYCSSKALYKLQGISPTDAPAGRQAEMGHAAHELAAAARAAFKPHLLIERALTVTLPSGLVLPGHADEIDRDEPSVTDLKTVGTEDDLFALRRTGSTEQQQYQRQLYYLGAHQAGLVPAEGIVRNVWIDRAGQADWCYVEQEPFSMDVVHQADRWISDVLYAQEYDEEATRDHHYDHCRTFCQFFTHCRAGQARADLVITDPEFIAAAELVHAGRQEEKVASGTVASAKRVLEVLLDQDEMRAYEAGAYRVRWSWINRGDKRYPKLQVDKVAS